MQRNNAGTRPSSAILVLLVGLLLLSAATASILTQVHISSAAHSATATIPATPTGVVPTANYTPQSIELPTSRSGFYNSTAVLPSFQLGTPTLPPVPTSTP